jgi:hypothetical protein
VIGRVDGPGTDFIFRPLAVPEMTRMMGRV